MTQNSDTKAETIEAVRSIVETANDVESEIPLSSGYPYSDDEIARHPIADCPTCGHEEGVFDFRTLHHKENLYDNIVP